MKKINIINKKKFFINVIVPTLITQVLFIILIFVVIIPNFKNSLIEAKKEMISELINSAICIADKNFQDAKAGKISFDEAKHNAIATLRNIRYGTANKDYIWITDKVPNMIMHPYRSDLNGKNVENFKDPNGIKMFSEMKIIAQKYGSGFVDYSWQWMDDPSRIVPKISYVKEYKNFDWIIGTGVYIEDVRNSINSVVNSLILTSLLIFSLISVLLFIIARRNFKVEKLRSIAEQSLHESHEKYKALVEASDDGTLMFIEENCIFKNSKICELIDCNNKEKIKPNLSGIISPEDKDNQSKIDNFLNNSDNVLQIETNIITTINSIVSVLISFSKVLINDNKGLIVIIKDLTIFSQEEDDSNSFLFQKHYEDTKEKILALYTSQFSLLDLPIKTLNLQEIPEINSESEVRNALEIMKFHNSEYIRFNSKIISKDSIINQLISNIITYNSKISELIIEPNVSISINNSTLDILMAMLNRNRINILIEDSAKFKQISLKSLENIFFSNSLILNHKLNQADSISEIIKIHNDLPILINNFINAGTNVTLVTESITSVSDKISNLIINLAIKMQGKPPCDFAFLALGSEGRQEQGLLTDQDNAIIYENVSKDLENYTHDYFVNLGKKITELLSQGGYKLCVGEIMASNPKWNQPIDQWKKYFQKWITVPEQQSLIDSAVFFDFRCIYGSEALTNELRQFINHNIAKNPLFISQMAIATVNYKLPLGMFGKIQTESDEINSNSFNIKNAIRILVNMVRLYAMKNNISETNTINRLDKLRSEKHISTNFYAEMRYSFSYLLHLQIANQAVNACSGNKLSNYIELNRLTPTELANLKNILSAISSLQSNIKFDFGVN